MIDSLDTNVILCKWKRTRAGHRLWVKGRPTVFGEGDTLASAEESLTQAVWQAAEDLDAVEAPVFVFDPPLPPSAATEAFLKPELYLVHGDSAFTVGLGDARSQTTREAYFEWLTGHLDSLYAGGICRACRDGIGQRTSQPAQIGSYESACDGGCIDVRDFWACLSSYGYVYSDRFLTLLLPEERARLAFQAVRLAEKSGRREYYESCLAARGHICRSQRLRCARRPVPRMWPQVDFISRRANGDAHALCLPVRSARSASLVLCCRGRRQALSLFHPPPMGPDQRAARGQGHGS